MIWLVALIVFIMLLAAVALLLVRSNVSAVALSAAVSLSLSVLFVILKAPDVAMTEAVVGSGLSAVILALALNRIHRHKPSSTESNHDA